MCARLALSLLTLPLVAAAAPLASAQPVGSEQATPEDEGGDDDAGATAGEAQGAAPAPELPGPETFVDAASAQRAAQEASAAGDFARAEQLYRRALELEGPALNWVGVADALERRGDVAGAAEALRTYLERAPEASDRPAIEQRLENLRALPGTVIVISDPPGEVFVDGERSGYVTPIELTLRAGVHTIGVTFEGEVPESHEVSVEFANAQRLELVAGRRPGDVADPGGEGAEGVEGAEGAESTTGEDPLAETDGADATDEGDVGDEGELAPPVDDSFQPRRAAGISLGIAAGTFAVGTVLGFMALSEQSDFRDAPSHASADRGERLALFSDVMFGVAGVAAVSSVVLYITDKRDREAREEEGDSASVRVSPVAGRRGAGVQAEVNF